MTGSDKRRGLSLAEAAREFWRHPTPWLLGGGLVITLIARLIVGDWRPSDAVLPLILLAAFPFIEWLIHVCVLHWRPRRVVGVMVDSLLARKHREHHANPRVVELIFIPLPALLVGFVVGMIAAFVVIPRTGLGLTLLLVSFAIAFCYEWSHYLIHTDYKPKTWFYRTLYRNHRLHHFKNEHYWFAVTTPGLADRALGTYPDPQAVATSPSAKYLHSATPKAAAGQSV